MSTFEALQSNVGTSFSKFLGVYRDYNTTATGGDSLNVDSISVSGDAEIFGQLSVAELTPTVLGPYEQQGIVSNSYSSITETNIVSGSISNVNITKSNGSFKYLYSGSPGVGYETVFYGSDPNAKFDWNGLRNFLSITAPVAIGLPNPISSDRALQIAPARANTVTGALVTDIENGTITGDFTGTKVLPGDYVVLNDGTSYKVTSIAADQKSLTAITGNVSWQVSNHSPSTYTIHNAGWYYDDSGDLIGEGYGYLQLPRADTLTDSNYYPDAGLLRWNQDKKIFEGYEGGTQGWVPIASSGSLTNKNFTTGVVIDTGGTNSSDEIKFFTSGQNAMFINSQQQIGMGIQNPEAGQKLQVVGNVKLDGTVTGQQLVLSNYASLAGYLDVGSSATIAGSLSVLQDFFGSQSGTFLGGLYVGSSSTIAGSLTVSKDFFGSQSGTFLGGLYVGSSSTIAGSLTVSQDFFGSQSGTLLGGLYVGSSSTFAGSLTVLQNFYGSKSGTLLGGLYVGSSATIAGSLTVQQDFYGSKSGTFLGGLYVGSGATFAGPVSINNNASITGSEGVTGSLTVGSSLLVKGSGTVLGHMSVASGFDLKGTLSVQGPGSVQGSLWVGSSSTIAGSLSVLQDFYGSKSGTLLGGLYVGSSSTIAGTLSVLQDFFGSKSGTFLGGLYVGSSSTIAGSLTVQKGVSITGDLDVGGNFHMHGTLTVDGPVLFNSSGSMAGSLTLGSSLYAPSASLSGTLSAAAGSYSGSFLAASGSISGNLQVGRSAMVSGSLTLGSSLYAPSASLSGTLTAAVASLSGTVMAAAASLSGNLQVGQSASISGSILASSASLSGSLNAATASLSGSFLAAAVSLSGNLQIGQSAFVSGSLLASSASLSGLLNAAAASLSGSVLAAAGSVSGNLQVGQNASITGSLLASSASVTGTLIASAASLSGTLTAAVASLSGTLLAAAGSLSGGIRIGQSASIAGSLSAAAASLSGSLIAAAASLSGSVIAMSGSLTNLQVGQSALIAGSLTLGSSLYASSASLSGGLLIQSASISGGLSVGQDATISGGLAVSSILGASASFTGTVQAATASLSGNVLASGGSLSGSLLVGQSQRINGSLSVGSTVYAQNASFTSTLLAGYASLSGSILAAVGSVSTLTALYAYASSLSGSNLNITSNANVAGSLSVGQTIFGSSQYLYGSLAVQQNAIIGGSLTVTQSIQATSLTLSSSAVIQGSLISSNGLYTTFGSFTGDANVSGHFVANDATIANNLVAKGNVQSYGTVAAPYGSFAYMSITNSQSIAGSLTVGSGISAGLGSFSSTLTAPVIIANAGSFNNAYATQLKVFDSGSFQNNIITSTFTGNSLALANDANINGQLSVNGSVTFNNNLVVLGTVTAYQINSIYGGTAGGSSGGGTVIMQSTSAATLTGTALSISQYGSILGNLYVGSSLLTNSISASFGILSNSLSVGSLLTAGSVVAPYGSFTNLWLGGTVAGNVYFSGTVTAAGFSGGSGQASGTIGNPTGRLDYGGLNIAGLLSNDLIPDAFYKVEQALDNMFTLPSTPNRLGQQLLLCSQETLTMNAGPQFTAFIQCSTNLVNDLYTSLRPPSNTVINMYDGNLGTLNCLLNGTNAGSLSVGLIPLGGGSLNQCLSVSLKGDFYSNNAQLAGHWFYVNAVIQPFYNLTAGLSLYTYQLSHSRSGSSNIVTFHIDDSVTPGISSNAPAVSIGNQTQVISGVLTYTTLTTVIMAATITGAIQSYFNSTYGLCQVYGSNINTVLEKNRPFRNVSSYSKGSSQPVTLQTSFLNYTYSENVVIYLQTFNAVNGNTSFPVSLLGGQPIRVDTVSTVRSSQVQSGQGDYPLLAGTDFGSPYDNNTSLLSNSELQQLNGLFQKPQAINYSNVNPASAYDYTTVNNGQQFRFVTFKWSLPNPISNTTLTFVNQIGTGWGNGAQLATGLKLFIRIIDTSINTDTNWLDANAFYPGGQYPRNNGDPCLLIANTTASQKYITLGIARSGTLYIRIGLDCTDTSGKAFANVTFTS